MAQTNLRSNAANANSNRVSVTFNGKTFYRSAYADENGLHFAERPTAFFSLKDKEQREKYLGTFVRALLPRGVKEGSDIAVMVFDKDGEQILLTAGKNKNITDLENPYVQVVEVFDPTKSEISTGYWVVEGSASVTEGRSSVTDTAELNKLLEL